MRTLFPLLHLLKGLDSDILSSQKLPLTQVGVELTGVIPSGERAGGNHGFISSCQIPAEGAFGDRHEREGGGDKGQGLGPSPLSFECQSPAQFPAQGEHLSC